MEEIMMICFKFKHSFTDGNEKVLIQDVCTRWNSTFDMAERFLELKPAIISSIACVEADLDPLTKENWTYLQKTKDVLQIFKESTELLSTKKASISQAIFIVRLIMEKLSVTLQDHGVKQLKRALKDGMEQRFSGMEDLEMYALATFLDPRYKGFMFRDPEKANIAKEKVAEKLEKLLIEMENEGESSINGRNAGSSNESGAASLFHSAPKKAKTTLANIKAKILKKAVFAQENSPKMEVDKFLEEYSNSILMEEEDDIYEFWKVLSQSTKRIEQAAAQLAEYYLAPPPSSVDVERLFSSAGDIITNERNRLLPENAVKVLFLREKSISIKKAK